MESIVEKNSGLQFTEDYTRYAIYVLFRRVIPDFRDGLKPVQRRILWAMYHDTKAVKSTVKSSAVVGDVLKLYHPHGDAATYGAIKPMVNWFESYQPLITGQGNFGSFQGDGAAAPRYTECKLNKFAMDHVIGDLKLTEKAVNWSPNYDSKTNEPDFLPAAAPMLLINGSFGIGVGLKGEIPSHNLSEVIDATLALIKNPNYQPCLVPDHCMPCDIIDTDWARINRDGFGSYRIRARIDIEKVGNKDALVIKSVPNLCYLDNITEKIETLVENKTIVQIHNAYDESDGEHMRYVIVLKPGSDPYFIRDILYKHTDLEQNLRINFIALDGLRPIRLSYRGYLLSWIEFRKNTKFRVYKNILQQVQTSIHEKEAFIKLLESGEIDNIIDMLKKQKTLDDNVIIEYLIKKLHITDMQAAFIINANIKKLSIAYLDKYKAEAAELEKRKNELIVYLLDDNNIVNDIVNELKYIKKAYGGPRRCRIINNDENNNIPKGTVQIVVTKDNFFKKLPMGIKAGSIKDQFKQMLVIDNSDNLILFEQNGRVFNIPVSKIPLCDKTSAGTDIRYINKRCTGSLACIIPMSVLHKFAELNNTATSNQYFIIVCTAKGMMKKIDIDDIITTPPSGTVYSKLDEGDMVSSVIVSHLSNDIIMYCDNKALRVNVSNIPYLKRNTKGNRLMLVPDGSNVEGLCVLDNTATDIVVLTRYGKINRINIAALPTSNKKNGFRVIKLGAKDSIACILGVNAYDTIEIRTLYNADIKIPINNIPNAASISSGVKIDGFTKGDCVIYALKV